MGVRASRRKGARKREQDDALAGEDVLAGKFFPFEGVRTGQGVVADARMKRNIWHTRRIHRNCSRSLRVPLPFLHITMHTSLPRPRRLREDPSVSWPPQ